MQRRAIVTGGGRGIGAAISLRLAQAGQRVAVLDLDLESAKATAAQAAAAGTESLALQADVTDAASVRAAIDEVVAAWGGIDVAVNNAGWDQLVPFVDTEESFWRRVIDINYVGVLRICQAVAPSMMAQSYGRIVNIGSDAARVGSTGEAVYSGAKGAVIGFSKTLARELARSAVTVNVVCPGPTDTPLLAEIVGEGGRSEKIIDGMTRAVPMRRLGKPEEIAAAVAFLASDEAGFITGQTLSVSGGLTMAG
jgi:2-hydroxycyclohexanecarboxyl-CoA dehydrogenase